MNRQEAWATLTHDERIARVWAELNDRFEKKPVRDAYVKHFGRSLRTFDHRLAKGFLNDEVPWLEKYLEENYPVSVERAQVKLLEEMNALRAAA